MGGSLLAVLAALALFAVTVALAPAPARAADLFLTGEREIYLAVDKLNAMGQLPGFLANTRPYSVAAVRAALDNNAAAGQGVGFDAQLARWVTYATKPTFLVRGTAALEADEKRETRANEGGVPTPKGVSARLSVLAREEATPFVSAHASAAAFFGEAGETAPASARPPSRPASRPPPCRSARSPPGTAPAASAPSSSPTTRRATPASASTTRSPSPSPASSPSSGTPSTTCSSRASSRTAPSRTRSSSACASPPAPAATSNSASPGR